MCRSFFCQSNCSRSDPQGSLVFCLIGSVSVLTKSSCSFWEACSPLEWPPMAASTQVTPYTIAVWLVFWANSGFCTMGPGESLPLGGLTSVQSRRYVSGGCSNGSEALAWSSGFYLCHLVRHQNFHTGTRYLGGHVLHPCTIPLHGMGDCSVRVHPSGKLSYCIW